MLSSAHRAQMSHLVSSAAFLNDLRALLSVPQDELTAVLEALESLPLAAAVKSLEPLLAATISAQASRRPLENFLLHLPLMLSAAEPAKEIEEFLSLVTEAVSSLFSEAEIAQLIERLSILLQDQKNLRRLALVQRASDPQQTELDDFSLLLDLRPVLDGSEIVGLVPLAVFRIATSAPDGRNAAVLEVHISMEECQRLGAAFGVFWQRFEATRKSFAEKDVAFLDTRSSESAPSMALEVQT